MLNIVLAFVSILSLSSGLVYYFYRLDSIGIFLSAAITIAFGWKFLPYFVLGEEKLAALYEPAEKKISLKNWLTAILPASLYLIFSGMAFYSLFISRTNQAIISPWQVIPAYFFVFYFLASLLLIYLTSQFFKYKIHNTKYIILIFFHFFLSFAVAVIIYKIGYGFDPFIHAAALKVIGAAGFIAPKTIYYSGYYGLAIILHKLFFIPLGWINTFLVPALAALVLPALAVKTFRSEGHENPVFSAALLLIFPFSFLIQTTPQNLAFLIALIVILLGLRAKKPADFFLLLLLSLAAFIIHPLAGLPLIFFSLAGLLHAYLAKDGQKLKILMPLFRKYIYLLIYSSSALSLPAAFYIFEKQTAGPRETPLAGLSEIFTSIAANLFLSFPNRENIFLNFAYLITQNGAKIFLLIALTGIGFAIYQKRFKKYQAYFFMAISLFFSYLLTEALSFSFLINYERSAYSDRILFLSFMFLLPFIFLIFGWYVKKITTSAGLVLYSNLIFFAVLIIASLYISYPRYDAYFNSRGYSTGACDLEAIKWINADAAGEKYIVLANQQVSAGALYEFGFTNYVKTKTGEEIFNYPIPTGGALYQYYLAMVYDKPTAVRINKAMNLADVKTGYFVLNKYWFEFPKVLDEAKLSADSFKAFCNGQDYVFKYGVK
ncbi:MAG: hypothetical protein WC745_02215 [Patescibacteria group bacterium]|jgi:hypothetical protein